MAVGVAEVEALASFLPCGSFFYRDVVFSQPCFPHGEFRSGDREGDVEFAVAVVGRADGFRTVLLEDQQNLVWASLHGAAARAEVADYFEAEDPLVEVDGSGNGFDVQGGFEYPVGFWRGTHACDFTLKRVGQLPISSSDRSFSDADTVSDF
jgi:hypothetical protein